MFAARAFPISSAMEFAGIASTRQFLRTDETSISELFTTNRPPGFTIGWNLLNRNWCIPIRVSGFAEIGEPISSEESITVQSAVPPRASGPYDGNHTTWRSSTIPACARSWPIIIIPWPPVPATITSSCTGLPLEIDGRPQSAASLSLTRRLELAQGVVGRHDRIHMLHSVERGHAPLGRARGEHFD